MTEQGIHIRPFELQAGVCLLTNNVSHLLLSQMTKQFDFSQTVKIRLQLLFISFVSCLFLHLDCMELIPTDSLHSPSYSAFGVRLLIVQPEAFLVSTMMIMFSSSRGKHI